MLAGHSAAIILSFIFIKYNDISLWSGGEMMPGGRDSVVPYILYAVIVVVFIIVMKMPKKKE